MITIYIHTNQINGKSYIGQTSTTIETRKGTDWSGYKGCPALYYAIQKYGGENFETHILEMCETFDEANRREETLIAAYQTLSPNGYNLTIGGSNGKPSAETRQKISEAKKGKKFSDEHRQKLSEARKGERKGQNHHLYGKNHSAETRQKISEAHKGKKLSDEHRKKISEAQKGENHPLYGKNHSAETRRKMSEAHKHDVWEFAKYISRLHKQGWSYRKLARYYGCSDLTIAAIIKDYESKHQLQQLSLFSQSTQLNKETSNDFTRTDYTPRDTYW